MNAPVSTCENSARLNRAETREVRDFERVTLRVQNLQTDLIVRQGQNESLVVEAAPDLLARVQARVSRGELAISLAGSWSDLLKEAATTSLARRRIRCALTVRRLTRLDIAGLTRLEAADLSAARLELRFAGPGSASFTGLQAGLLDAALSGPCKVEIAGSAGEQKLAINGLGFYDAPGLESRKAAVCIQGPGQATLWVTDSLEADIAGPGRLEYYGDPRVRQKIRPLGSLVRLDR